MTLLKQMLDVLLAIPYPRIDPTAFAIGPIHVRWYALAYVAGLVIAWWHVRQVVAQRPKGKRLMAPKDVDDLLFWATFGVVLGGRLGYVLFYKPGFYIEHPLQIFTLWEGGMSFHGGLIGVILAMTWIAHAQAPAPLGLRSRRARDADRPVPGTHGELRERRAVGPALRRRLGDGLPGAIRCR